MKVGKQKVNNAGTAFVSKLLAAAVFGPVLWPSLWIGPSWWAIPFRWRVIPRLFLSV